MSSNITDATQAGIKAASSKTNNILEKEADSKIDKEVPPSFLRDVLKVTAAGMITSATTLAFSLLMRKILPNKIQKPSFVEEATTGTLHSIQKSMETGLGFVLGISLLSALTHTPIKKT